MGYERRFSRQFRPDWLNYVAIRRSAKKRKKLPQDSCIHRNADRLSPGFAGQPFKRGLAQRQALVRQSNEKSIELSQAVFSSGVPVAKTALEQNKCIQIIGDRTLEDAAHRGTRKATSRSRLIATRTYTDVEDTLR